MTLLLAGGVEKSNSITDCERRIETTPLIGPQVYALYDDC